MKKIKVEITLTKELEDFLKMMTNGHVPLKYDQITLIALRHLSSLEYYEVREIVKSYLFDIPKQMVNIQRKRYLKFIKGGKLN